MTKKMVTWLGEDVGDAPGPSFTTWGDIKFQKDKPVEIDDEEGHLAQRELMRHILVAAASNHFFKVEDAGGSRGKAVAKVEEEHGDADTSPPPPPPRQGPRR